MSTLPLENYQVDWFSFTVNIPRLAGESRNETRENLFNAAVALLGVDTAVSLLALHAEDWNDLGSRRPYQYGDRSHSLGVSVWYGGQEHALIEISGKGCQRLARNGELDTVFSGAAKRATRVDIAIDYKTAERPLQFVERGVSARIKSRSHMTSQTGETLYLGSRTSDRSVRVYRYDEPHERSHLLRTEFQFRRKSAKNIAKDIALHGAIAGSFAHLAFAGIYLPDAAIEAISPTKSERVRESAKTEAWLIRQAAPAFKRLIEEGVIDDPSGWLERHFLSSS